MLVCYIRGLRITMFVVSICCDDDKFPTIMFECSTKEKLDEYMKNHFPSAKTINARVEYADIDDEIYSSYNISNDDYKACVYRSDKHLEKHATLPKYLMVCETPRDTGKLTNDEMTVILDRMMDSLVE